MKTKPNELVAIASTIGKKTVGQMTCLNDAKCTIAKRRRKWMRQLTGSRRRRRRLVSSHKSEYLKFRLQSDIAQQRVSLSGIKMMVLAS